MKIRIYNGLEVSKESIRRCKYTLKLYALKYEVNYISASQILEDN